MLKLAQTDRPTDRPTDRAKTILYLRSVNMKKAPLLGGHVFHDIIGTLYRVLKRFFESRTIAPTDNRSYAKFDKADRKMPHPPGTHVFEPTGTIFELAQDIILTNLLTKFHDDGQ
ncbi:hypothetical protein DPMN_191438 [Dreissena polymorpha]|uniref:Uncharacterized protein n=1 Tax=Dreissena polymorpha TaxID=45954 RepID=A0A9D3XYY0_DREPO|nr:hypothetical protein DPMN_191438 [Dreissena polymorpha]